MCPCVSLAVLSSTLISRLVLDEDLQGNDIKESRDSRAIRVQAYMTDLLQTAAVYLENNSPIKLYFPSLHII